MESTKSKGVVVNRKCKQEDDKLLESAVVIHADDNDDESSVSRAEDHQCELVYVCTVYASAEVSEITNVLKTYYEYV